MARHERQQFVVAAPADHSNDGAHDYEYRALDNSGLASDTGTCTVRIDTSGPTVTDDAPADWNTSAVTVTLSPVDSGSGIYKTQYRLAAIPPGSTRAPTSSLSPLRPTTPTMVLTNTGIRRSTTLAWPAPLAHVR